MSLAKTFLSIGIALVFTAFIAYAVNTIYEPPKYDIGQNDCYIKYDCYKDVRACEEKFYNRSSGVLTQVPPQVAECNYNITKTPEFKACQAASDKCSEEAQRASPQYAHAKNTFIILLIIGIAAIIGGSRITVEGVGSGFIGGGVLLVLYSIANSWAYLYHLDRYLKLAGLGLALAVLIWIAYKRMESTDKK